ncbi:hypothetical protein BGZ80_007521, partial [Entomortierella chlamydospora]
MLRNLFSSQTSDRSTEETLGLTSKRLELARKEDDTAKRLELINSVKPLLKDTENTFASKKVKDPALSEGIANAYHEHGRLLDDLGHHDKAKKSRSKAEKWGYVDAVGRNIDSSHPLGKNNTVRRSLLPTAVPSIAPIVAVATPAKVKPTSPKNGMQIQQKIFDHNVTPPITKYALPEPDERITSTPQLAYCLSLLHSSMISQEELDQIERDWLQIKDVDPDERERLQTMATDLIRAFVREDLKKSSVIAEAVSLTAVLEQEVFRKLLQVFVNGISQSLLLDVHLLNGLAQLIRNAPEGYIDADDLVKVLELLNGRLKDTHKQSTRHTYQLAMTISQ